MATIPDYEGNDQYDLNEPDWNRLGRNEKISRTIVSYKENNKTKDVPISFDIDTWEEPSPYYNAFYPENKVFYTHHGLLVELDDTIDNRRIHIYHPSNTYIEINEYGNLVFRNSGNRYDIIDKSLFKLVKQDYYRTISGTEVTKIEGEQLLEVDNDYVEKLHSDKKSVVDEHKYTEVKKNENLTVGKSKFTLASNDIHLKSNSMVAADSGKIYLNSGRSLDAKMNEDYELQRVRKKVQQGNRWWNVL